jgi:major membrane immunogen (membrane-anchored lipoprotein)
MDKADRAVKGAKPQEIELIKGTIAKVQEFINLINTSLSYLI